VFYPGGLAQRRELEFAAGKFNTVELNGSFYSMQRPQHFARWYEETPEDFVFAVKGSRYITHMLKLRGVEDALANFFAQGVLRLEEKLGPVLWQFPEHVKFDLKKFEEFFAMLPRTRKDAAKLAKRHDHRLNGRAWTRVKCDGAVRHAVEIRDESFACEEFIRLLRRQRIGLVVADTVAWPLLFDVTADFVYCRLHGSEQLYASKYEAEAIEQWAQRVARWASGCEVVDGRRACAKDARRLKRRDVYVYFDNDAKVHAPFDAMALRERVGELCG
jgi:uncharacterized protein YecE (DUF72 family)